LTILLSLLKYLLLAILLLKVTKKEMKERPFYRNYTNQTPSLPDELPGEEYFISQITPKARRELTALTNLTRAAHQDPRQKENSSS